MFVSYSIENVEIGFGVVLILCYVLGFWWIGIEYFDDCIVMLFDDFDWLGIGGIVGIDFGVIDCDGDFDCFLFICRDDDGCECVLMFMCDG